MKHRDKIEIKGLRIQSKVGVPDEERANAQELQVDLLIRPSVSLQALSDDIAKTIDYFEVSKQIHRVAQAGSRRLIETLAEDIAHATLDFEGVEQVEVEVKKYILPDAEYVSVKLCLAQNEQVGE